jgi:hypothetical protein
MSYATYYNIHTNTNGETRLTNWGVIDLSIESLYPSIIDPSIIGSNYWDTLETREAVIQHNVPTSGHSPNNDDTNDMPPLEESPINEALPSHVDENDDMPPLEKSPTNEALPSHVDKNDVRWRTTNGIGIPTAMLFRNMYHNPFRDVHGPVSQEGASVFTSRGLK